MGEIQTASDLADGSGDAVAAAVTGWVDRRSPAVRDAVVSLVTAGAAFLLVLTGAAMFGGLDELVKPHVWMSAGAMAGGVVVRWVWMVATKVTTKYGSGSGM